MCLSTIKHKNLLYKLYCRLQCLDLNFIYKQIKVIFFKRFNMECSDKHFNKTKMAILELEESLRELEIASNQSIEKNNYGYIV